MRRFSLRTLIEVVAVAAFAAFVARMNYIDDNKPPMPRFGSGDVVRWNDDSRTRGTLVVDKIHLAHNFGALRDRYGKWMWLISVDEQYEGSYEELMGDGWVRVSGMIAPESAFEIVEAHASMHDED